jgi:hypothetical protein
MKKEITAFCNEYGIELPEKKFGKEQNKKWGKSDTYMAIYAKYDHEIKKWQSTGADGRIQNHALLLYDENDLKEYFGVE